MLKRCLLHDRKRGIKQKPLTFNNLHKPLIFHVFASEETSVRKYSLIFGVELKTRIKNRRILKICKCPIDIPPNKRGEHQFDTGTTFIESKFHGTHDEPFWSNPTGLLKTQNELFEKQYQVRY